MRLRHPVYWVSSTRTHCYMLFLNLCLGERDTTTNSTQSERDTTTNSTHTHTHAHTHTHTHTHIRRQMPTARNREGSGISRRGCPDLQRPSHHPPTPRHELPRLLLLPHRPTSLRVCVWECVCVCMCVCVCECECVCVCMCVTIHICVCVCACACECSCACARACARACVNTTVILTYLYMYPSIQLLQQTRKRQQHPHLLPPEPQQVAQMTRQRQLLIF